MKKIIHKADTRGGANHGWLKTYHTFSFAGYQNPERVHFGALRVLNDDTIAGGTGFGKHPHNNMEIITIPLSGTLKHEDSMGNSIVIRTGDVQVMSAGTGVYHSEHNANLHEEGKFLQIWVFPKKRDVEPRYDQITLDEEAMKDKFAQILSPNPDDEGTWIHQDAWFSLGKWSAGTEQTYTFNRSESGVYVFMIEGSATVAGETLQARDGIGIWETNSIDLKAETDATILLMEIPMELPKN